MTQTIASLLGLLALAGCQSVSTISDPAPKTFAQGQVWLAQGHYHQATQALHAAAHRMPDDSQVWRALGKAYWRAGVEAMATSAALNPQQTQLNELADQVFELERYLNERTTGYRVDRDADRIANYPDNAVRIAPRVQVVEPVWSPR